MGKLKEVTLRKKISTYYRLPIAISFAKLPSLKTLVGGLGFGAKDLGDRLWSGPLTSGVEVVRAHEPHIEPRHFSAFFTGFRNLSTSTCGGTRIGEATLFERLFSDTLGTP